MVLNAQSDKTDYKFDFVKKKRNFCLWGFMFAGRGLSLSESRLLQEPGKLEDPEGRVLLGAG